MRYEPTDGSRPPTYDLLAFAVTSIILSLKYGFLSKMLYVSHKRSVVFLKISRIRAAYSITDWSLFCEVFFISSSDRGGPEL